MRAICFGSLLVYVFLSCTAARSQDLNTELMNSTFEITGPGKAAGSTTGGTVFFLGKPMKDDPQREYYVLITAAHVLDKISGDDAILFLRKQDENGSFSKEPYPIKLRQNGKNLYVTNSDADVAAMYEKLPKMTNLSMLPVSGLADDALLEKLKIHAGDELLCLGFPLSADLNGFPIIRTGILASYPITPSKSVKQYYYAFHIFPGNSGGPVYFNFQDRMQAGTPSLGGMQQGIIGLVSQQVTSTLPEYAGVPLDLAIVIPSSYIKDTLSLLPDTPE